MFGSLQFMGGHWGHFGSDRGQRFERGALKFVVLDILKDNPTHGYEIIKVLEDRSHGFYTPSAGSVYPTLQLLADMGYITAQESDGKKVYAITDPGRAYLKDNQQTIDRMKEFSAHQWPLMTRTEWQETFKELRRLGQMFRDHHHELASEQILKIRQIVQQAAKDIEKVIEPKSG